MWVWPLVWTVAVTAGTATGCGAIDAPTCTEADNKRAEAASHSPLLQLPAELEAEPVTYGCDGDDHFLFADRILTARDAQAVRSELRSRFKRSGVRVVVDRDVPPLPDDALDTQTPMLCGVTTIDRRTWTVELLRDGLSDERYWVSLRHHVEGPNACHP